jgi:hypothetical protein
MRRTWFAFPLVTALLAGLVVAGVPAGACPPAPPRYAFAEASELPATPLPTAPAAEPAAGALAYRGFTVDITAIQHDRDAAQETAALEHQLDVVADSGVKPEILAFFRAQHIVMRPGARDRFSRAGGIEVDTRLPPQQPIVLHELLHAYHAFEMPQGARNPEILAFYEEARNGGLYPAGSYVLVNPMEFFAVTGSLYLSGHVDRPPGTRETLRARQPRYYAWLGQLFGVAK